MKKYYLILFVFISSCSVINKKKIASVTNKKKLASEYPLYDTAYLPREQGSAIKGTIGGYDPDGKVRVLVPCASLNAHGEIVYDTWNTTTMHLFPTEIFFRRK